MLTCVWGMEESPRLLLPVQTPNKVRDGAVVRKAGEELFNLMNGRGNWGVSVRLNYYQVACRFWAIRGEKWIREIHEQLCRQSPGQSHTLKGTYTTTKED